MAATCCLDANFPCYTLGPSMACAATQLLQLVNNVKLHAFVRAHDFSWCWYTVLAKCCSAWPTEVESTVRITPCRFGIAVEGKCYHGSCSKVTSPNVASLPSPALLLFSMYLWQLTLILRCRYRTVSVVLPSHLQATAVMGAPPAHSVPDKEPSAMATASAAMLRPHVSVTLATQ